jgi:hypothetical protein
VSCIPTSRAVPNAAQQVEDQLGLAEGGAALAIKRSTGESSAATSLLRGNNSAASSSSGQSSKSSSSRRSRKAAKTSAAAAATAGTCHARYCKPHPLRSYRSLSELTCNMSCGAGILIACMCMSEAYTCE